MGLGQVGLIQAKSRLYIMIHGSFMIGAWICAASVGIMIARYSNIFNILQFININSGNLLSIIVPWTPRSPSEI